MSEPKTLMVNDVKYVREDAIIETSGAIRIVILQRGWVMVGRFSQSGSECTLDNASVIRVWGTTRGLGELAINGPLSGTKLDPCPTVKFHELTVIATINCVEEKWKSKLL
jgi:hypothetical protein